MQYEIKIGTTHKIIGEIRNVFSNVIPNNKPCMQ